VADPRDDPEPVELGKAEIEPVPAHAVHGDVVPAADAEQLTVEVDPRSGIWIAGGIVALSVVAAFFDVTQRSLTVVGVGVLLAFAIEPLVLAVQRRAGCSRGAAVGAVGTGLLIAFAALAIVVGPAAVRQAQDFGDELPQTLADIEDLPVVGPRLADADFSERVETWVDDLPGRLDSDGVESAARGVLAGALNGLGVLLVALVVLLDGPTLVARLRLVVPSPYRERADAVGRVFYRVVGTYFAGSLLVASIGGTWVLIVGLAVGVPLAPVAAVWYAVVSLIPQIGGFLGTSFVTILALTQGVVPALIVLVLVVAYMNTENYVITPAIVGEAVDLSPPVTMLAALVGGAAAGVPGALAATPLCGTVKAVYMEAVHGEKPVATTRLRDRLPDPVKRFVERVRRKGGAAETPPEARPGRG
jgi:predicted PurR-regulated permease PerM